MRLGKGMVREVRLGWLGWVLGVGRTILGSNNSTPVCSGSNYSICMYWVELFEVELFESNYSSSNTSIRIQKSFIQKKLLKIIDFLLSFG